MVGSNEKSFFALTFALCFLVNGHSQLLYGQATKPKNESTEKTNRSETEKLRQSIIQKSIRYLAQEGQSENGAFTERARAGITALAVTSTLKNGKKIDDPVVTRGQKALEEFIKPDGGFTAVVA